MKTRKTRKTKELKIVTDFNRLKKKYPEALIVLSLASCYVLLNEDARKASKAFKLPLSKADGRCPEFCPITRKQMDTIFPMMILKKWKVVIYNGEKELCAWKDGKKAMRKQKETA